MLWHFISVMSSQVRSNFEHLKFTGIIEAKLPLSGLCCNSWLIDLDPCVVCAVPCEEAGSLSLPAGLTLLDSFVSPEEEALLLAALGWSPGNDEVTGELLLLDISVSSWVVSSSCKTHSTVMSLKLKKPWSIEELNIMALNFAMTTTMWTRTNHYLLVCLLFLLSGTTTLCQKPVSVLFLYPDGI